MATPEGFPVRLPVGEGQDHSNAPVPSEDHVPQTPAEISAAQLAQFLASGPTAEQLELLESAMVPPVIGVDYSGRGSSRK